MPQQLVQLHICEATAAREGQLHHSPKAVCRQGAQESLWELGVEQVAFRDEAEPRRQCKVRRQRPVPQLPTMKQRILLVEIGTIFKQNIKANEA